MKIICASQAEAQAYADKVHAHLIAKSTAQDGYADSVDKGHTKRWAFPTQDQEPVDPSKPFGAQQPVGPWYINLSAADTRWTLDAFTAQEQTTKFDQPAKDALAAKK